MTAAAEDRSPAAVTLVGRRELVLPADPDALAGDDGRFEVTTDERTVRCSSGRLIGDRWRGVGLASLIDAADAPPETTHLRVTATDDYRTHVELARAMRGLLALDGESSSPATLPRLIVPGTGGGQAVKSVSKIEFLSLDPGDDPATLE
ncbi:MAG: molybdopterin-dependent oxidoreductase [Salinigranum sp.]